YFVAYEQNNVWTNLSPQQTFTVGASGDADAGSGGSDGGAGTNPNGPGGTWNLKFDDEFDGTAYDTSKWADNSSAEGDSGHGNQGNKQLEWNQGANCTVSGGVLTMTAKRQSFTSPSGTHYDWTSCLLTTTPSYSFQYGYIEERAKLPAPKGFWPAFWTWQAPSVNTWLETDVYEFYSDNHNTLYLTDHAGSGGGCQYTPSFDPSASFHTYGADIEPNGVTWYIDGVNVCSASGAPSGLTNIIANLAVFADVPPDASTTTATKQVDYIRAWQH
ncbi:MAG TPA: glycoside hydrolase family 16 protein, partial [Polyangiaceae bacterium]|nr:glycoside hydrolase family 16 protein [Polyangiaceae bacterium]